MNCHFCRWDEQPLCLRGLALFLLWQRKRRAKWFWPNHKDGKLVFGGGEMRFTLSCYRFFSVALLTAFLVTACGGDNPPPPPPAPVPGGPIATGPGNGGLPGGGGITPPPALPPNGGGNSWNPCGNGYYIEIYYDVEYCVPARWGRRRY